GSSADTALIAGLHRGVERTHIERDPGYRTPVKTGILAGGIHSAKQQVVRIDREPAWPLADGAGRTVASRLASAVADCDAVVLSDYGSGLITPELADGLRRSLKRSSGTPVPVLVDSRYRLLDYKGMTICTPNEAEVEQMLGVRIDDDQDRLERAGRAILTRTRAAAVLVTRGSRGMALFQPKQKTIHIAIFGSDE